MLSELTEARSTRRERSADSDLRMSSMYPHVADSAPTAQRVISLNVGGTIFTTSLQTLKSDPESTLAGKLLLVAL